MKNKNTIVGDETTAYAATDTTPRLGASESHERARITRRSHMDSIEERFPLHEHNENAQLCRGAAYRALHPEMTVPYSKLPQTDISGFPVYIARNESGELEGTFTPDTHALIIGSTGSGKTTGFALPFLNWMGTKKNKPTIIISDPKDELNEQTANLFTENGYNVVCLNFKNYAVSDCWNPLTKIYRLYQKYLNIEDEVSVIREGGIAYNVFRGKVYRSQAELDTALYAEKDSLIADISDKIGNIAEAVSPVAKKTDPYWDQISASFVRGFLWAMLEDSTPDKKEGRITEETYNFDTLIKIYDTFTDNGNSINDHGYFSKRNPETSRAYQLVMASIIGLTASSTRSCIVSCFSEKIKKFRDTSVRRITCANTIDIESLDNQDKPTVVFISYKDEDSLHYGVISLFISDLYTTLIEAARNKGGSLSRPCYFLLDEFGNFPQFKDFEHVISACRSRNIWFFLIVQSYAQLYRVYDKETADIIIDNLNMHLFYGSCNYETKAAFSKECGMHEVTSGLSAINGTQSYIEHYSNELVPLVPISRLSQLDGGECIVTQMRGDVIWSNMERSYLCPEYDHGESKLARRSSPIPFFSPKYTYNVSWLTSDRQRKGRLNLSDL